MKKLIELNPKWIGLLRPNSGEGISFDCPVCGSGHTIVAYFSNPLDGQTVASWQKQTWKRIGDSFETLTIEPSIQYQCFHGWVEDGQVINISESKTFAVVFERGAFKRAALSPRQVRQLRAGNKYR